LWNHISFYPEYFLLKEVISSKDDLNFKKTDVISKLGIIEQIKAGFNHSLIDPNAPVVIVTSIIWISVLSPHGLLLTAFLKSGWNLSEPVIGVFRALGAVFGLSATFIYPSVYQKKGTLQTAKFFITIQSLMLILSLMFFVMTDG